MSAESKSSSSELQAPPFESSPSTGRPRGVHSRRAPKGYQPLPQEEEEDAEPQEAQPEMVPQSAGYPPMQPIPPPTAGYPPMQHGLPPTAGYPPMQPGPPGYPPMQQGLPPTAGYPPMQPGPPLTAGYPPMQPGLPPTAGYSPSHHPQLATHPCSQALHGYSPMQPGPPPGYPPTHQGGYPPNKDLQPHYQAGGYGSMSPPPPSGYAPAPPVLTQQSSNVVVVNQPGSSTERVETVQPQANDHMGLTLVIMLLCFLHGNLPAFACLIPALCFSYLASQRNDSGDYEGARSYGNLALFCNILVFIYYVLAVVVTVIVVVVITTT